MPDSVIMVPLSFYWRYEKEHHTHGEVWLLLHHFQSLCIAVVKDRAWNIRSLGFSLSNENSMGSCANFEEGKWKVEIALRTLNKSFNKGKEK